MNFDADVVAKKRIVELFTETRAAKKSETQKELGGDFMFFYVHPCLGKIPILTSIFFRWVGSTTNQKKTQKNVSPVPHLRITSQIHTYLVLQTTIFYWLFQLDDGSQIITMEKWLEITISIH